ncbi:hypothetical protein CCACVL1_21287 [Corchorus capsularis]|uniref:Uncharacterized protein n=1 Tax=Corchorus capsularis TaxID=210143 RepID=A0A1R3H748_COCAP|nr:hypothetical protein CCACVL1_21287 [Corchorus capsularis]
MGLSGSKVDQIGSDIYKLLFFFFLLQHSLFPSLIRLNPSCSVTSTHPNKPSKLPQNGKPKTYPSHLLYRAEVAKKGELAG